jgi:hypothetical protein
MSKKTPVEGGDAEWFRPIRIAGGSKPVMTLDIGHGALDIEMTGHPAILPIMTGLSLAGGFERCP